MVNKPIFKAFKERDTNGAPPPRDESWWEAVLAEEEAHAAVNLGRRPTPPAVANKPAARNHSEPAQIDWELARDLFEQDEVVCLQVTGYNRGGLLVGGERLQGFVPISHLIEVSGDRTETEQEDLLCNYLERTLQLKVIECDEERGRVVFSERAALTQSGSRNILLTSLKPGECAQGAVTNITDFGVFVDLGGIEGLVHVSEISWGRVRHPSDVVQLGDQVQVHVINVDQERGRVALSMKRMRPNPWETAEERYHPGQVTEAVITSVVPFGAFARLEEGLDGLIHISEMTSDDDSGNPLDALYEGLPVQVRVLHVDSSRQRLGLSLQIND
jgi:small subunit ribosomal protein S1